LTAVTFFQQYENTGWRWQRERLQGDVTRPGEKFRPRQGEHMNDQIKVHPDMDVLRASRSKVPPKSVAERRQQWADYTRQLSRPAPDSLLIEDRAFVVGDRKVLTRVYRPRSHAKSLPCIIYMHGGGFTLGDLDSSDSIAWGLAHETGAVVVSVDYRLSPEHPWPAAFDDCYGVLVALRQGSQEYGIDSDRIALAGDSAGGRLAAGLSIKARDQRGPRIVAQALVYASAGAVPESRSREQFADGFGLTAAAYEAFYKALFPTNAYDDDPSAWPIRAHDLTGLPPTLVHVAEIDPIRDDGRAFASRLISAGGEVTFREAKGMLHGFMRARFFGAAAKAEFDFICAFLRAHLGTSAQS
jgi:acetyl esterase